jgi:enoyl-CoA hydratase/carnithine racemase
VAAPIGIDISLTGSGVTVVTIDRPEKANALDGEMHRVLTTVWKDLEHDDETGAIVLTGRGTTFCGGGDREKWAALAEDRRYRRRRLAEARDLILNMLRCELPIVAAVNGPAVGVGCSLVLACDIVLMARDAYLADPHVAAGIVAGDGGAALLPEMIPLPLARQLLFTGARLDAMTARQVFLASEVVDEDVLLPRAIQVAATLAGMPGEALRDTKRAVNLALLQRIAPALEFGSVAEGASFDAPDFVRRRSEP